MRNKALEHLRMKLFCIMNKKRMAQANEHDKKIYSQLGEDGYLEYLFQKIGTTSKKFVEMGVGDGTECNTRNLVENWGWSGTMVEGDRKRADKATKLYKEFPVIVFNYFVTIKNRNFFLEEGLDLLSIDIDGNDYWIWKALKLNPRVVIIEYNSSFGEKSITIPLSDSARSETHPDWLYHGASLRAMVKLGNAKGYKLVYANGTNAIFIRRGIESIEELDMGYVPEDYNRRRWGSPDQQFELIKDKDFVEV